MSRDPQLKVAPHRRVALLLPGMTLNGTIFPELGIPTVCPEFNRLQLGTDGVSQRLLSDRMRLYADLLDGLLERSQAWQAAQRIVVGHSFGAMLALQWLLDRRDVEATRVDGLVLISASAGPLFDRVTLSLLRVGSQQFRLGIAALMPLWNHPFVTQAVKWLVSGGTHRTVNVDFRAAGISSDVELDLAGWRNTDWRAMRSYRVALDGFDVRERLTAITVPTIVLHGTEDALFEVAAARDLAQRIPGAELRLVEGAGHALPLTHGEHVGRAVHELLER